MKINFYLGFNNYYNRQVKKFDNLDDYQEYLIYTVDNVNFKPGDGISTTQKVDTVQYIDNMAFMLDKSPDYAIVCEDDNTIVSRWFVMQFERIRAGQYLATLRRDVIADNFESIIEAPCFIEKATITKKTDIAIFNNENMAFNQIKQSEVPLKDTTQCPWIVGYLPTNVNLEFDINNPSSSFAIKYNGLVYAVKPGDFPTVEPCESMPFILFAMPYVDNKGWYIQHLPPAVTTTGIFSKELALKVGTGISKMIGSGSIFDVQLLPFCPIRQTNNTLRFSFDTFGDYIGKAPLGALDTEKKLVPLKHFNTNTATFDDDVLTYIILWNNNKFSFDIERNDLTIPFPDNALDIKVQNECDMWRLCSPNFQGQFEFNAMKNGGVRRFNVDCLYQPYSPYIHINPEFGNLYGQDFDDARGLICGGDFSLPQETSAWANYIQNNKNYQSSFDRQILNMETMNRYSRREALVSGIFGSLQGGVTGAMGGAMIGGPVGAIAGGAIGVGASAIGGIADYALLSERQKETLDYTKDQFNFNMQNIKAMPNNITKTNPFTNNNKVFPILEYYTCTDTEKQALKDKMTYNGMTIGRIGKISDWLLSDYSYIKGQIIKLDDVAEDYHMALTIADEINKGIRAKKED